MWFLLVWFAMLVPKCLSTGESKIWWSIWSGPIETARTFEKLFTIFMWFYCPWVHCIWSLLVCSAHIIVYDAFIDQHLTYLSVHCSLSPSLILTVSTNSTQIRVIFMFATIQSSSLCSRTQIFTSPCSHEFCVLGVGYLHLNYCRRDPKHISSFTASKHIHRLDEEHNRKTA